MIALSRRFRLSMRALGIVLCILAATALVGAGFLIPAYFQAVDPAVAGLAAERSPSAAEAGRALALAGSPEAGDFLAGGVPAPATGSPAAYPVWARIASAEGLPPGSPAVAPLLTRAGRLEAVSVLSQGGHAGVATLLAALPGEPGPGASGEQVGRILPVRIGGLLAAALAAERALKPRLLAGLSGYAEKGDEAARLSWAGTCREIAVWGTSLPFGGLARFIGAFDHPGDLRTLTASAAASTAGGRALLARMVLAGAPPEGILAFLDAYPSTGFDDLRAAFSRGPGAALLLLERGKPLRKDVFLPASVIIPDWMPPVRFALEKPEEALLARIALFTGAGFFLLWAFSLFLPNPGDRYLAKPSLVQNVLRRLILASILAGTLLFFLEPSLLRQPEADPPAAEEGPRLSLSTLAHPPATPMNAIQIDDVTLLILLIFFVLQVGLYVFCLVKLSEIRRQRVPEATKLHLLENEENLFDGGLYLGLGGTVASLIFLALGVVEASLMAAYASTLFGILFVSFFKIFHLRPLRRRLILSATSEA